MVFMNIKCFWLAHMLWSLDCMANVSTSGGAVSVVQQWQGPSCFHCNIITHNIIVNNVVYMILEGWLATLVCIQLSMGVFLEPELV